MSKHERILSNVPIGELAVGQQASLERSLTWRDIQLFALASNDINPLHLDPDFAASTQFHHVIAHGMWTGALISSLLGAQLPGPGTIYLSQSLKFLHPIALGDTIHVSVTVTEIEPVHRHVTLACLATNQAGATIVSGEAVVIAPARKLVCTAALLPDATLIPATVPEGQADSRFLGAGGRAS